MHTSNTKVIQSVDANQWLLIQISYKSFLLVLNTADVSLNIDSNDVNS